MKSTSYSFDAVKRLIEAFLRSGYTSQDLEQFSSFSDISAFRDLICQRAALIYPEKIMDSNKQPTFNTDYVNETSILEHLQLGQVRFSPKLVDLRLVPGQDQGVDGHTIHESLKGQKVLNAQILHLLLCDPCFIPLAWRNYNVCFWGSLIKSSFNGDSVMTLHFMRENFFYEMKPLDSIFNANYPAVVFKDEALVVSSEKKVLESSSLYGDDW